MTKRSLVLVTVDCLRADHVGFGGYSHSVTPFLDALAKSGVVFSQAIVAGVPTYFSFPAILASRYPLGLGRGVMGIAPGETTIATILRNAGYRTAAFLAGNPYLSPHYGYDQGFETFSDFLKVEDSEGIGPGPKPNERFLAVKRLLSEMARRTRLTEAAYNDLLFWYGQWRTSRQLISLDQLRPYPPADVVVDNACSWLRRLENDHFFLWIHLMDPHHPHYPPAEALASIGASDVTAARARLVNTAWNRRELGPKRLKRYVPEILSLYDAGVRWVDEQLARFVRTLRELQRWEETIFVFTADHGEEFLEHGVRYHPPTSSSEQLIRVPLLLHAPGVPPARLSETPFSMIHLAPTLLEGMGLAAPSGFQGSSHWAQIRSGAFKGEPAIVETVGSGDNPSAAANRTRSRLLTVRDRQYKLVLQLEEGKDQMFDLKNDPEEQSPLPESRLCTERARLLQVAAGHLRNSRLNRNAALALHARLRELRQGLPQR